MRYFITLSAFLLACQEIGKEWKEEKEEEEH